MVYIMLWFSIYISYFIVVPLTTRCINFSSVTNPISYLCIYTLCTLGKRFIILYGGHTFMSQNFILYIPTRNPRPSNHIHIIYIRVYMQIRTIQCVMVPFFDFHFLLTSIYIYLNVSRLLLWKLIAETAHYIFKCRFWAHWHQRNNYLVKNI